MAAAKHGHRFIEPRLVLQVDGQGVEPGRAGCPVRGKVVERKTGGGTSQLLGRALLKLAKARDARSRYHGTAGPLHPDGLADAETTPWNRSTPDAGLREDADLRLLARTRHVLGDSNADVFANSRSGELVPPNAKLCRGAF